MTSTKENHNQDCKDNRYDDWLEQASNYSLGKYFMTMPRKSLIDYIKQEYGSDGKEDVSFEDTRNS